MMPSGPKEQSLIDTDKHYTAKERLEMCRTAVETLRNHEDIEWLTGSQTGASKFYVVQVKLLEERVAEYKMMRAFECPTKPSVYLQVRYQKDKGITISVIIKEDDINGSSMVFELKVVDTVTESK